MVQKITLKRLIPVMFGFFIMGFVDVVGIASNYIKQDFQISDTVANLVLTMVYVWFVLFSIPTGVLMGRIGRRKTDELYILLSSEYQFITQLFSILGTYLGTRIYYLLI